MDWQSQLISLYLVICKHYQQNLFGFCQRMSNNNKLVFSDDEAITIFIFGLQQGHKQLKQIHTYAYNHLRDYFPKLPGYSAFSYRINRLKDVFIPLIEILSSDSKLTKTSSQYIGLVDAMPIIMAQGTRRYRAKVAPDIASPKGYCAVKGHYYYGTKLHVIAARRSAKIPVPKCISLTPANCHERKAYDQIAGEVSFVEIYGDKAYQIKNAAIYRDNGVTLHTPVKRLPKQTELTWNERYLSRAISKIRQSIESLFNWINEKTGIQNASKVRSKAGLIVHVFGRLAAAMIMMIKI